jgi:pyruvate dehydrogenase E2 component (dihydrolipoamide acetyltransferase)
MIEIKVPDLGEDIEAAEVISVLVAEGDVVAQEQAVLELETEKATFELPCPHAGRVARVHVAPGDEVRIGQVVLTLEELEAEQETEASTDKGRKERKAEQRRSESKDKLKEEPASEREAEQPQVAEVAERAASPQQKDVPQQQDQGASLPSFAGPATRQLARELGVTLDDVKGTGPGGRITDEDVRAAASAGSADSSSSALSEEQQRQLDVDLPDDAPAERIRMSKLMRTAAERLADAWRTIPHVTQHEEVDFTELEEARRAHQRQRGSSDPRMTLTVLLIRATLAALREHPRFNASIDVERGEILLHKHYSIGVAVDTEHGLLVPVLHHAERRSVRQLAEDLEQIVRLAQQRKLAREDLRGATFSISNQGGLGGTAFTPIINPPEVAILGVSRTRQEQRPDGSERLILPLSLSYDHRVNNGADAVRFMSTLARALQSPFNLLMES